LSWGLFVGFLFGFFRVSFGSPVYISCVRRGALRFLFYKILLIKKKKQRYIHNLLTKTNMLLAKPIATPMSASTTLSRFEGSTIIDSTQYRSTVGSLQYLSLTRPDIAFAINKVSQFMQDPRDTHWSAVKRILWYLKSTISHTFCISKNSSKHLTAYSDSD
jgi:hypothetical protein